MIIGGKKPVQPEPPKDLSPKVLSPKDSSPYTQFASPFDEKDPYSMTFTDTTDDSQKFGHSYPVAGETKPISVRKESPPPEKKPQLDTKLLPPVSEKRSQAEKRRQIMVNVAESKSPDRVIDFRDKIKSASPRERSPEPLARGARSTTQEFPEMSHSQLSSQPQSQPQLESKVDIEVVIDQ